MGVSLFSAAAVLAIITPSTATSRAPPLKTITHVRSSPFCTALRENIGHAIAGLLANDQLVEQSKPVFYKMAHDYESNSSINQQGLGNLTAPSSADHRGASMHLDTQRMEQIADGIVHNLEIIDKLLNDPMLSANPTADDERALEDMRARLSAVAQQQRKALNVLEGSIQTYDFDDLLGRGNGLNGALGKDAGGAQSDDFFTCVLKRPECKSDPSFMTGGAIFANNPFGRFFDAVTYAQRDTQALEQTAAKSVITNARRCPEPPPASPTSPTP